MSVRLVSFPGLGNPKLRPETGYAPVRYRGLAGGLSDETPIVEAALVALADQDFGGPITSAAALATEAVRDFWFGDDRRFARHLPVPAARCVPITDGATERERWETFGLVVRALTSEARADLGETAPPSVIVFDVTHGFRSTQLIALGAIFFVLAERQRQREANPPPIRVVYGAYEARDHAGNDGVAPIWDLTALIEMARWNEGFSAFLNYGRADLLEALGAEHFQFRTAPKGDAERQARKQAKWIKDTTVAMRQLADDLAMGRTAAIMKESAPQLMDRLRETALRDAWVAKLPLLAGPLATLEEQVATLVAPTVVSEEGLTATAALARFYLRIERFLEMVSTLREGAISHYDLRTGDTPCEPGEPSCAHREAVEGAWNAETADHEIPPEKRGWRRLTHAFANAVQEPRNDMQHAGYRATPMSAKNLRKKVVELLDDFDALVAADPGPPVEVAAPAGVLNLTNHPLSEWSPAQRTALVALGLGEPVDLPAGMPLVDPQADADTVAALAGHLVDGARAANVAGACVQGEHTLSFALVSRLQRAGVRCFSATTRREVEIDAGVDGTTRRARFRFERWREYPSG